MDKGEEYTPHRYPRYTPLSLRIVYMNTAYEYCYLFNSYVDILLKARIYFQYSPVNSTLNQLIVLTTSTYKAIHAISNDDTILNLIYYSNIRFPQGKNLASCDNIYIYIYNF